MVRALASFMYSTLEVSLLHPLLAWSAIRMTSHTSMERLNMGGPRTEGLLCSVRHAAHGAPAEGLHAALQSSPGSAIMDNLLFEP